jgi:hypothetical protein
MRIDGRTDMTKLIVAFRNFTKKYKKCFYCVCVHGANDRLRTKGPPVDSA